jgi:hypothetical protein
MTLKLYDRRNGEWIRRRLWAIPAYRPSARRDEHLEQTEQALDRVLVMLAQRRRRTLAGRAGGLHLATVDVPANAQVKGSIPRAFPPPFPPGELGFKAAQAVLSDRRPPFPYGLNGLEMM